MRTVFTKTISAAASLSLTLLAVAASSPAAAAAGSSTHQAVVRVADLDLTSPAGHRAAMRRIGAAATQVCRFNADDRLGMAGCRAEAVSTAVQTLHGMSAPQRMAAR